MKIKDRTHIFYFSYFGGMKDTQDAVGGVSGVRSIEASCVKIQNCQKALMTRYT